MSSQHLENLDANTTDRVVSLGKGIIGIVPFAGPLLAEIVGNVIPNQRMDRLGRYLQLLEERLKEIEQEMLKQRLTDPSVVDILEDSFYQAARALTAERIEHIADVVAHGLSAAELNQAETKRMLWLLGQLNDIELLRLRSMLPRTREEFEKDSMFSNQHEAALEFPVLVMGSSEKDIEQVALHRSYKQHLVDLGLVSPRFHQPRKGQLPEFDDQTGMLKASGHSVTTLGRMLLKHLNLIPEWYTR